MSAAQSFLGSGPSPEWIEFWTDLIHSQFINHSPFIKLMNTDHPDSRRTASEIHAMNDGVDINILEPGHRFLGRDEIIQPGDEFFCNTGTWEPCRAAIGQTRAFYEKGAPVRRKITDVGALHDELRRTADALHLMTAGRDQDGVEHREAVKEFQTRLEAVVAAHSADIIKNFESEQSLMRGNERLKQQRNSARAEIHTLKCQIAQLRQDTFPQSLDVIQLRQELECAIKQRDEYKDHADRNRAGRVTAENELRNLRIDGKQYTNRLESEIRALNQQLGNQPIQVLPSFDASMVQSLHKECDRLRAAAQDLATKNCQLQSNNADLHNTNEAAGMTLQRLIKERDAALTWKETADGLEREIIGLRTYLVKANTRVADLEPELKASTERNKSLIAQREQAISRWRDDNRLAEQRLVRIRELESEISALGKLLQSVPPQCGRVMACVDGHLYSVDDLCKMHSALKEQHRSVTEAFEKDRTRLGEHVQELLCKNADLCADVAKIRTEYSRQAKFVGAQWKLGFDCGVERVMKYVSAFSKDIAESIARNTNPSNPS